jgi:UDP-glucose 4-epimerase
MSVLVTGAAGFIGSHLVERLSAEGARVRALCRYNSHGALGWLDDRRGGQHPDRPVETGPPLEVVLGDVRDAHGVEEACHGVDVVFHLAALISIPHSYAAPESYLDTNVRGTFNVLEAVRRQGVPRLVHVSTSEVYGTPSRIPITESHPLNAQSPYAASKVAAEQFTLAYHRSFGVAATIVRPFNTYGPRQSTRAVLPSMLEQLLRGVEEVDLGHLEPRRDLTYVTDTADGIMRAGITPAIEGEVIQLGTGRTVSIGELLEIACRQLGVTARPRSDPKRMRPGASEVWVLQSDPSVAHARLGWKPEVSLEAGIARTAEWMRSRVGSPARFYR